MRHKFFILAALLSTALLMPSAALVVAADVPNPSSLILSCAKESPYSDSLLDIATALAVDADGNVFVTGYSLIEQRMVETGDDDTADDDTASPADDDAEPEYEYDYDWVTVKWEPEGLKAWANRHTGENGDVLGDDKAWDVAADSDGNSYVTGTAYNAQGDRDIVTVKYDADGGLCWTASFDGPESGFDRGNAVALDDEGNVYVTGLASVFDEQFGVLSQDVATIKYDADGNRLWFALYSFGIMDQGKHIAVDADHNVYVSGLATTFMLTLKYDSEGEFGWVSQYFAAESAAGAAGLAVSAAGDAFVAGGAYRGDQSDFDFAAIKYSAAGKDEWIGLYGGADDSRDVPTALFLDTQDHLYVTGYGGEVNASPDYITIKYDALGQEMWRARYSGPEGADYPMDIALDSANRAVVTGSSLKRYVIAEDFDIATVKYDIAGQAEWTARYDSPDNLVDQGTAVAVDSGDNVLAMGTSVARETGPDFVVVKYTRDGDELWVGRHDGPGEFPPDGSCPVSDDDDDMDDDGDDDDMVDDDDSFIPPADDDDDDDNDDGSRCG